MGRVGPAPRWGWAGLRFKLACALFGCALVSLGSGTVVATYLAEEALGSELADKLQRAVAAELLDVERYLDRAMDDLATVADNRVMQDVLIADDMGEIADSLSAFQSRYGEFGALFVADETGAVIASEGIDPPPDLLSTLEPFHEGLAGRPAFGQFGEHPALVGDSLLLSMPIRADYDANTVIGVLLGTLDIEPLRERLSVAQVADRPQSGERLLVLTADGTRILYRTDVPDGDVLARNLVRAVRSSTGEAHLVRAEASEPHLLSSAALAPGSPFGGLGLELHSAVSETVAFDSVARLRRNLLLTTLMIAAAILPMGWFGARTLTGPLATVTAAMTRIAQGADGMTERDGAEPGARDLIPPSVLARRDELGVLGRGFSTLMDQLAQARARLIEQSKAELGTRSRQLDAALENMSQGLCMFDEERRLVVHNRRFIEIFGLAQGAIAPRMHIHDLLLACEDAGNYPDGRAAAVEASLFEQLANGQPTVSLEPLRGGQVVSIVRVPMATGGWVTTFEDITERRQSEARIEHMALHDALTGLPNRVMFHRELERAVSTITNGNQVAVLCLDLDRFKAVNDTLGHPVGDELLRAVAGRLQACLRPSGLVARLGGDEFAIVETNVASLDDAATLARRVIDALGAPYQIAEHQVTIGTSVGIALGPVDGLSAEELVKAADMALYAAKADGRSTFRFFEQEMDAHMQRRRALELDLRRAVVNGEFELHYQPLVNLETDRVSCFEALLRWRHASRGWVPPSDFIPLAEEIGLIDQIGRWVLWEACHAAKGWPREVRVAVNLSPAQFRSTALVSEVEAALDSSGLAPTRLELEITESVLLQQTEQTLSILNRLRALGVRISMDDFGTGYSSLSYLRSFPFDKIKIDRSFINGLGEDDESLAIVRAVSGLGVSLGMTTTAEGVETLDQLERLRQESCTEVQGYYFSQAVPAAELPALLATIGSAVRPASAA